MTDRARHREPLHVVDEVPDTPVGEHTHEQPRSPLITALTIAVVVLSLAVGWLGYNTYQLQQGQSETTTYLGDARDRRDTQNEELNERIDTAVCSLLDRLPAGALFDPARERYGCGPGMPVDELDPQVAQNLADILADGTAQPSSSSPEAATPPQATSAPDEMPPGAPPGARPSPIGQPPAPTTAPPAAASTVVPQPTTSPAPTTPPLVDLTPLTDPVCALLSVCVSP